MADMNTILGLGQDLLFEGKRYRVSDDLSFSVQADFERWLKSQVMKNAMEAAGDDPELGDRLCRLYMKDSLAGEYRLEGEIARKALMQQHEAAVKLLHLLLEDGRRKASDDAPEVSESLARKMLEDKNCGPWAMGMCLVALGLDPRNALVLASGLVLTRASIKTNQQTSMSQQEIRESLAKNLSGDSSESALSLLVAFLDSPGGKWPTSSGATNPPEK